MSEKYKCPYCEQEFLMDHLRENHIRQSSGDHGEKYKLPADYKERIANVNKENISSNNDAIGSNEIDNNRNQEIQNEKQDKEISQVIKVKPPEIPITETNECPDCGTTKEDWIPVREAYKYNIQLNYKEIENFDYVCSVCMELIKVK